MMRKIVSPLDNLSYWARTMGAANRGTGGEPGRARHGGEGDGERETDRGIMVARTSMHTQ